MTENTSTPHVTTPVPVDVAATDVAEAGVLLNQWLGAIESVSSDLREAFRSQVNGIVDALKLVVQQKFGYQTCVGKIVVTGDSQSYSIFFHYQIPLVSSSDRRPKADTAAKLAGIVKDPRATTSTPPATMLAVHMFIAGKATGRTVQLQADTPGLIKYYEKFGYTVDEGQSGVQKPTMTATLDAMSLSNAAKSK
ncbi:MAG TPA: hypothetical protein VJ914_14955 [Pseudonocardiaceae bacterium]|nr:hypothetical protein [Pseudonocardiaceae bacterium]